MMKSHISRRNDIKITAYLFQGKVVDFMMRGDC